jgi:hypothetical protein
MCDYSLSGIQNRLAVEGETLIVHQFHTGSKGLTSSEDLQSAPRPKGLLSVLKTLVGPYSPPKECAVCIPDGARLTLEGISDKLQEAYHLSSVEKVTFRQLSASALIYRDAVEFGNGMKVRLQELEEGQRLDVLALASEHVGDSERQFTRVDA